MAERTPLVRVGGYLRDLPAGDTVAGGGSTSTIVGITGTKAEFDTAVTDGELAYQNSTLRLENRTDDPGSPAVGEIWFRTDL